MLPSLLRSVAIAHPSVRPCQQGRPLRSPGPLAATHANCGTFRVAFMAALAAPLCRRRMLIDRPAEAKMVTLDARPEPIELDPGRSAVIVVDMQNSFASKGGMFDLAGVDISGAP